MFKKFLVLVLGMFLVFSCTTYNETWSNRFKVESIAKYDNGKAKYVVIKNLFSNSNRVIPFKECPWLTGTILKFVPVDSLLPEPGSPEAVPPIMIEGRNLINQKLSAYKMLLENLDSYDDRYVEIEAKIELLEELLQLI